MQGRLWTILAPYSEVGRKVCKTSLWENNIDIYHRALRCPLKVVSEIGEGKSLSPLRNECQTFCGALGVVQHGKQPRVCMHDVP